MADMVGIKVGFCQRCGRAVKLKNSDGRTQAEWDAKATEKCRCPKRPKKNVLNAKKEVSV